MTDDTILKWFPYAFPFFFVGMWMVITTMLGVMSGWFNLQQWYADDGSEEPLLRLGGQSISMGMGVGLNGCVVLSAYPSGLGVRIWRVFALFQKPLRIPWSEIEAEESRSFFVPLVKVNLGRPSNGTMKINARSWSRLVDAVPKDGTRTAQMPSAEPVAAGSVARAMLIQWMAITAIAATFFYFASRSMDPRASMPLGVCIAFPAVVFGIGQLIRYSRES